MLGTNNTFQKQVCHDAVLLSLTWQQSGMHHMYDDVRHGL